MKLQKKAKVSPEQVAFKETKSIHLANGLEVILIKDKLSFHSGAALSVATGSNNDPADFLGLAHLTEHMLFIVVS